GACDEAALLSDPPISSGVSRTCLRWPNQSTDTGSSLSPGVLNCVAEISRDRSVKPSDSKHVAVDTVQRFHGGVKIDSVIGPSRSFSSALPAAISACCSSLERLSPNSHLRPVCSWLTCA